VPARAGFTSREYAAQAKRLEIAIRQAEEAGFLGDNILGSGFSFHIHIH